MTNLGASHRDAATDYKPLLDSGAAICSSERRSAETPIHASIAAAKTIAAAAIKYPINNAVLDPVPMIQPNSSGAPTPPTRVPSAKKIAIAIPRISKGERQKITADVLFLHAVESHQHKRICEKDRVIEKCLR